MKIERDCGRCGGVLMVVSCCLRDICEGMYIVHRVYAYIHIYIYVIQSIQSGLHYIDSTVYIVYIN